MRMGKLEKTAMAFAAFVLAGLALFSFEKAVFKPLIGLLVSWFGDRPETYWLLLVLSCFILVFLLGRRLPFYAR